VRVLKNNRSATSKGSPRTILVNLTVPWAEVDWNGAVVRLDPRRSKNGAGRLLPITRPLRTILKRRQRRQHADNPVVFHRDGVTVRTWKHCWAQACAAANLKGRYLHDCRRTAARNLVRAGITERIAMALLGHKTRCMFDRYNIVSERDLRQAGDQLSLYMQRHQTT
jgi:integrase